MVSHGEFSPAVRWSESTVDRTVDIALHLSLLIAMHDNKFQLGLLCDCLS